MGNAFLHVYNAVVCERLDAFLQQRRQRIVAEYAVLPDVSAGVRGLESQIGAPYDDREFVRIGLRRWGLGASRRAWTCTQFVMAADAAGVIPEWRSIDRSMAAPSDLLHAAGGASFRRIG